ncbi:MAG: tetratricopeptide repeat protein [Deltaproteobacteria bacterium]|nr:tetratricopeptide repeat protein [Deltaproteobacteria bacterium]
MDKQVHQLFAKGYSLLQAGNTAQALVCFQAAITLDPLNATLQLYSGAALHDLGRYDEAVASYLHAIQITPEMGEAYNNLGNSLMALGRFTEAADSFLRAAELLAASPVPLAVRCTALQAMGKVTEAEVDCRRAIQLDPGFAAAHWNLALNLLLQGKYEEGWQEYEWRWKKPDFTSPVRHNNIPLWDGSPLDGRTILLHAEQGFGDAIQFVRYVPMVVECGGNVVLECHPQLVSLFQGIKGVLFVAGFGEELPVCDCQAPFLTLPRIFGTTVENIPSCHYLLITSERREKWQKQTSKYPYPRIGIVWAGSSIHRNDISRSLPLEVFSSFANLADIQFFSLQMGDAKRQLDLSPLAKRVVDLTNQIRDFADTAALIEQLDLVITIDSAVAHLAGSLGKPVWLMLAFAPDWRWLLERSDSPWYPSIRIFRQSIQGDWGVVVKEIKNSLVEFQSIVDLKVSEHDQVGTLLSQGFYALKQGALESAELIFTQAETIMPNMPDVLCGLAQVSFQKGMTQEAISLFRRALNTDPGYYQCLLGLGMALQSVDQYEEAEKCYQQALGIKPEYAQALNNLGTIQRATGRLCEALESYDRLLALQPDHADGHFNRSLVLLQLGRFREGWTDYEWRFLKFDPEIQRHRNITRWEGQPIHGKRILIHAEQGYGDTIQFIRYARLLAKNGAVVIVEAQDPSIISLLECVDGVTAVYPRGAFNETVDYQLPIMSLPMVFRTHLRTIPECHSYIKIPPAKSLAWKPLLQQHEKQERMRIGLVWAGRRDQSSDRNRSVPFDFVSILLDCQDFYWYSLQIGEPSPNHPNLIDITSKIHDFSGSASLISNLDLVITVDTSVAHLVGAMGKPVWVMLKYSADWRWLLNCGDSPWYPSMHLFRQEAPGEWGPVISRISSRLSTLYKSGQAE